MRVVVVGGGGREHAIVWKLFASPEADVIFTAPGNAGTALLAQTLEADPSDLVGLAEAVKKVEAGLVVVGPEAPLAAGIVDVFAEHAPEVKVFGPTRAAAQLEWSKVWAKGFLQRNGIPTARAEPVEDQQSARAAIAEVGTPCVIKADGLAAGKGVWVANSAEEADAALEQLFVAHSLGEAGGRALIEEKLEGPELSVLAFTDGERLAMMPPARDYKRLKDGDQGPNTGGMGGYTRPPDVRPELLEQVERDILTPTIRAMAAEGRPYRGVLYAGLMLTREGPKVLEFNCRFGDPEAQLILPLLESDLLEICLQVCDGQLDPASLRWGGGVTCGVVLASEGYPDAPIQDRPIRGLDELEPGVLAFHGATAHRSGGGFLRAGSRQLVTTGGRVVTVVATAPKLADARALVYENLELIDFEGKQVRTDIGLAPAPGWGDPPVAAPVAAPIPRAIDAAPPSPGVLSMPVLEPAAAAELLGVLAQTADFLLDDAESRLDVAGAARASALRARIARLATQGGAQEPGRTAA